MRGILTLLYRAKNLLAYIVCVLAFVSEAKAAACSLALAFALDVSSSVNSAEYEIQKGGLADALRDDDIRAAILNNPGSIHLLAYEWSGASQQAVILGWSAMTTPTAIDHFATGLDAHGRSFSTGSTALGQGIAFGIRQFAALPANCARKVIDISGDGVSNDGVAPLTLRENGGLKGVTINGLVIKGASPDPEAYYRENVISGSDAFMMTARNGFDDYPELIRGKILRELRPPLILGAAQ